MKELVLLMNDNINHMIELRNIELEIFNHMIKNNFSQLKIEQQFKRLINKQNNLKLSQTSYKICLASKYGIFSN